jgi:hypothetical protein
MNLRMDTSVFALPVTSGEWAAWVLAVGAIAAIAAAIWISYRQETARDRRSALEKRDEEERVERMCMLFGLKLRHALHKTARASAVQDATLMELEGTVLHDITQWPRNIPVETLNGDALEAFFALRILAVEARARVDAMMRSYSSYTFWQHEFEQLRDRTHGQLCALAVALRQPIPGQDLADLAEASYLMEATEYAQEQSTARVS